MQLNTNQACDETRFDQEDSTAHAISSLGNFKCKTWLTEMDSWKPMRPRAAELIEEFVHHESRTDKANLEKICSKAIQNIQPEEPGQAYADVC